MIFRKKNKTKIRDIKMRAIVDKGWHKHFTWTPIRIVRDRGGGWLAANGEVTAWLCIIERKLSYKKAGFKKEILHTSKWQNGHKYWRYRLTLKAWKKYTENDPNSIHYRGK